MPIVWTPTLVEGHLRPDLCLGEAEGDEARCDDELANPTPMKRRRTWPCASWRGQAQSQVGDEEGTDMP